MGCSHSIEAVADTPTNGARVRGREPRSSTHDPNNSSPSNDEENEVSPPKQEKRILLHSKSAIEQVNEIRQEEGDLKANVVHIEFPFGKPIEEVYDGVHSGPILGKGVNGDVRLITHKITGHKYAVKCLDLAQVKTEEGVRQLREEIVIMCQLDHPNIVRLEEVYESHSQIYLVQELCLGGDLFDRLDEQPDYRYNEAQCARLVKQMLGAVRYLHSKGIVHRDLKLENFLFSTTSPDSELMMIDFGLSKHFKLGEVHHEAVGTPYTAAPEIFRGSYDEKCDVWAIGVLTYLLLSGDSPFGGCGESGQNMKMVRSRILRGNFYFKPESVWSNVSSSARDFIRMLLRVDHMGRPTAMEAQQHIWLRKWCSRDLTEGDNRLSPGVVQALVSFKGFSDIHRLLCEVLSFTLLPEQVKDLKKEFEKMDKEGSGLISLPALKQVLLENAGSGSLAALTEAEVEDIFDAMLVRKSEQQIQWHEFIAAGLTQCQVDERNLRLAFDRLDNEHKGFITFEDIVELVGKDDSQTEEILIRREMWDQSVKAANCHHARIMYDDFLLLMKGQCCVGNPVCQFSPGANLGTVPDRQMRLAVLEASQRFQEQETRWAQNTAMALSQPEKAPDTGSITASGAGLVMRRHMDEQERQIIVDTVSRRGGRGGRIRVKTVSDMSCLLSVNPEASGSVHRGNELAAASFGKVPQTRTFATIESLFCLTETENETKRTQ